jgi:uncharacterized phosphosugar-binding protein
MSTAMLNYLDSIKTKIDALAAANLAALEQAASLCAQALARKQVIHIYDTGHIISHELINRTGGLVAYAQLSFDGALDNRNLWRAKNSGPGPTPDQALQTERALIEWLFGQRTLQAQDVLIIGSVSGVGLRLVELALQARERGLGVIAVTGPAFSSRLPSKHPSGMRLYETADVVLDNLAEYGDSFFRVPGIERKLCPISGVSAALLMWSLTVGTVERLAGMGLQPSIYESVNQPNGPALVQQVEARYQEQGL